MTDEQMVDHALDRYIATMRTRGGIAPDGVHARTLAQIARVPVPRMSDALSVYRGVQGRRVTRYTVGCRGYGPAARWHITRRPGSDPAVVMAARRLQAIHIVRDAAERCTRDAIHEVYPALRGTAVDEAIRLVMPLVAHQFEGVVQHVERVLAPPA